MSKHYKVVLKDEDIIIQCPNDEEAATLALTLSDHLEQDLIDVIPMNKQRKDFPNKWKEWMAIPSERLEQVPVNVFFTYRVHSHVLDDETYCLFRLRNLKTGRRSEKVYKSKRHALEFLKNTALEGKYEITMVTDDLVETYDPLMQAVDIDELF
jgi:hypothetical protein